MVSKRADAVVTQEESRRIMEPDRERNCPREGCERVAGVAEQFLFPLKGLGMNISKEKEDAWARSP